MPQNTPRGYTYPLYTDPQDVRAAIQELATDLDTDIEALADQIFNAKNRRTTALVNNANQTITANTDTQVTLQTVNYDNGAMAATPNGINIPIGADGIYLVTGRVQLNPSGVASTYDLECWITSSAGFIAIPVQDSKESTGTPANKNCLFNIMGLHYTDGTVVDQIRLMVRHNATASLTLASATGHLTVTKVSNLPTGD